MTATQRLDRRFAQTLVDIVAAELNKNVNITDERGLIIASFSKERIGQIHEAAANMLATENPKEFAVSAEDAKVMPGVREGFNVPIRFSGVCAGVLGVTGNPDEAAPYARLAARFAEAALEANSRQEQLLKLFQEKKNLQSVLLNKVIAIQEEERKRISRELHDETGQMLTSIIVGLRVLSEQVSGEAERQTILEMRDIAAKTLDSVKRLAIELRPALLDDLGLEAAVYKYIQNYGKQYHVKVNISFDGLGRERFTNEVELALYRSLQEALTNIAKHAAASEVDVAFRKNDRQIVMRIRDNGIGFNVKERQLSMNHCLGLYGMKERISLLDGIMNLSSAPGEGTTIEITIPLK